MAYMHYGFLYDLTAGFIYRKVHIQHPLAAFLGQASPHDDFTHPTYTTSYPWPAKHCRANTVSNDKRKKSAIVEPLRMVIPCCLQMGFAPATPLINSGQSHLSRTGSTAQHPQAYMAASPTLPGIFMTMPPEDTPAPTCPAISHQPLI